MTDKGFALIPARGGSKGIKGKNLQKLGEHSLIARTIIQAYEAGFERVIALSDDHDIRLEADKYGADTSFIRPLNISEDKTHMFVVYKWLINEMLSRGEQLPDYFCTMLCTTPFRRLETVIKAKKALDTGDYDWVLSVNEFEHHPARSMSLDNGMLVPTYDLPASVIWSNRQELPIQYRFNGGVISGKTKHVLENDEYNISAGTELKVFPVFMSQMEAFDIDTPLDLEFARHIESKFE